MKKCSKCKIEKNLTDFTIDKRKSEGRGSECKNCYNIKKRKFRNENREYVNKQRMDQYYRNHERNKLKQRERAKNWDERQKKLASEKHKRHYWKYVKTIRKKQSEWRKTPQGRKISRELQRKRKKRESYKPIKIAYYLLEYSLKKGYMTRPDKCSKCLKECKPEGHHDDYTKPLEVRWLCNVCHRHEHGKLLDLEP